LKRLIDQCLRNRIIESVEALAAGPEGVRLAGAFEYFETLFDHVHEKEHLADNSALSPEERDELARSRTVVGEACRAAGSAHDIEVVIASGWPDRLSPEAQGVLGRLSKRGRCSEHLEEVEPPRP